MSLIFTWSYASGFHIVLYSWSYLNSSATDVTSNVKVKALCIFAWLSSAASIPTKIRSKCRYFVHYMTVSLWNRHTPGFSCSKHYSICPSYPSICQKVTDPVNMTQDANILWLLRVQPANTIDKLTGVDLLTFLVWVYCEWNHYSSRTALLIKSHVPRYRCWGLQQDVGRESLLSSQTIWDPSVHWQKPFLCGHMEWERASSAHTGTPYLGPMAKI